MNVHHLDCGTLTFPGGRLAYGDGPRQLVCHCLAVETDDGVVLVDGGLGVPDLEGSRLPLLFRTTIARATVAQAATNQLPERGIPRDRVRHVVVTHLDLDHAGGLLDFPDATVHVLQAELDAATQPQTFLERRRYIPAQLRGVRFAAHAPTERWLDFAATGRLPGLPDGIRMVSLPGHSRGHAGVAVRQDDGWLLHCGDAWFFRADLGAGGPPVVRAFQQIVAVDRSEAARTRQALAAREATGEVRLINTHDPSVFAGYTAASP